MKSSISGKISDKDSVREAAIGLFKKVTGKDPNAEELKAIEKKLSEKFDDSQNTDRA